MTSDQDLAPDFELIDRLEIDPSAWIAPTATVVGSVSLGRDSSIWFGCVVRGDLAGVRIGAESNLQDGVILHVGAQYPCTLGDRVSLGHGAIVHGATVEDDCLIAMRATVLNGAVIGRGSIVGAGAVVPAGMQVPPDSLVVGVPAKVVRSLSPAQRADITRTAQAYVTYAKGYRARFGPR